MSSDAPRGVFITFEGGEGAGKSTQIARLAAALRDEGGGREGGGREVVTTREPGGTPRAGALRAALLRGVAKPYGPFAEALMFAAARIDHIENRIRPALARGAIVLCDRFSDSTRAYQGAAGGLEPELIASLERVTLGDLRPDLTLILDLPPEAGLARAQSRGEGEPADRFEAEGMRFHQRLRAAFRAIAEAEPERCRIIDADLGPDAVEAAIRAAVAAWRPDLLSAAAAGKGHDHAA